VSVFSSVSALARRQHGTITRSQLDSAGLSDRALRRLVSDGVLERAAPGVYVVGGSPDTWHRRLSVELHRAGPLSVVSHRAAAGLIRLDRYRPGHLDLAAPWASARTGNGVDLHRSCDLPARDRTVVDGLPVTTPTRTLIDMGRYVSSTRLGSMIDDAVRRRLTSYEELAARHAELARPGRAGIRTVAEALADRPCGAAVPGSPFEVIVRQLLIDAGIPVPVLQHPVPCDDMTYVLDLAWPALLVAVECDGFRFHRTPEQLEWDDRRRTELGRRGWLVHHVTWRQYRRDPDELVAEVRRSLSLRSG
jgi:hypothetical protein